MVNKYIVIGYVYDGPGAMGVQVDFVDSSTNTVVDRQLLDLDLSMCADPVSQQANAQSVINTYISGAGYTITYPIWPFLNAVAAPSSYQTIVTQTGTAAPAVSGSLAPINTYSGAPTLTWARTGTGVYTLTASTAVFNTSGKTGVFVAPLQNLNASVKAVVTSSTVITVTTAVQSVAVLGLLGLTTTATDALLNQTMLYVQTYS